jgi:hypothetical protein
VLCGKLPRTRCTPTTAVFLSSPSQPGPQFRLSYQLKGSTCGKFQMRMPGETEFKSYLESTERGSSSMHRTSFCDAIAVKKLLRGSEWRAVQFLRTLDQAEACAKLRVE